MTEKFASSKFADFTNVQELYRSQAGAVFRALFKYDQKEYVLKERKLPKYGNTKDIMNEVKLLSQLDHSNVIRCEGWFRDESRQSIFIVLEFCAGGDLNSVILKQRTEGKYFDESQIWDIFYQLCVGLKHLHEHGIIHRDLKPLNIFCSRSGQTFKIGDLGVSRQVSEDTMMLKSFYGTPLYLSPELVDNKPYNEKTDIWSLGVILYELCALQPPFKGNTLLDVAKLVSHGRYSPIPKHYSAHLTKCVAWMLNLDFNKRPNVAQLLAFVELRRPVATAAAVSPQRKNRNTKSKRRPAAGQKPTAVEVQIQQQDDDDNCNFVPAADGYGGGHGSDSDDTRMDDDSLEEGRGGRDEGNRNRKNEKKGEGQEQQQGSGGGKQATNQRAANLAGNNRDSDNDSDTESDCTLPQEEEEEELVPFKQRARVAHNNSSSSYRNNCGGRGAKPNSEKGVHKKEKVASQPSAIPAIVDPIPRRQNIRELRQDRNSAAPALPLAAPSVVVDSAAAANKEHAVAVAGQRRERGAIPKQIQQQQAPLPSSASAASAVTVQADCQRLQVLLRRELTTLRKLLQIRDFVALKFNGENDTDLLPDEVCSREGEGEGGGGVVDRIKLAQFNAQVLEKAINCNGMISETYAKRFKLISSHGMEVEASSAPLKEKQEGQEKKGRRAVVTQLPHRPGEEAVLGLDINADRAGHSRHLADSHYFPREAADHPDRVGQPGGLHSHSHKQSRHSQQEYGEPATAAAQAPCSSPQRKEVPYRGAHVLLEYGHGQGLGREDDSEDYRRGRGRDNHQYGNRSSTTASATAAACEIGRHSHSPKAVYQPPITQKQGLFRADLVQPVPVPVRRPVTVSAGQRRPPSQPTVPTAAAAVERPAASAPEEEYRIFDERSDRRRPGTAGAPSIRDPREPPPLPDDNGLRKERLLAMWDKQQQQEGRGLGLPSMRAEDSDKPGRGPSRPKTAMSRLLGGGGAGGGGEGPGEGGYVELKRMNPPEGPTSKSKGRDLMQYQDIMYSCREISDRQRQPVHRRQKSDVTNPSYVLPPPPSSPPANGDKRGGGGHHRQQQRQQSQFQFQFGGKEVGGEGRGERRKERGGGVVGDGRKRVSMVGEVRVDVAPAPAADDDFIGEDGHALAHVVHPQGSSSGKEIRLRGTGSRANGEMLPSQQARMHKDSAYNIICGT